MPTLLTHSPTNPEFARVVPVAGLRRSPEFAFDIAPEPGEAAALAALLAAEAVRRLRFAGTLRPDGAGWRLDAVLGATVVQPCVVTLEPVTTRIDVPVHRRFQPITAPATSEVRIEATEDDELEPLGDRIDLGLVAIEALALAVPAYPRRDGATLPDPPASAEEPVRKPFAGLAELRRRMGDER